MGVWWRSRWTVVGVTLFVIAVVVAVGVPYSNWDTARNGRPGEAVVEETSSGYVTVSHAVGGEWYKVEVEVLDGRTYAPGDTVRFRYMLDTPDLAVTEEVVTSQLVFFALTALGAGTAVLLVFLALSRATTRRRVEEFDTTDDGSVVRRPPGEVATWIPAATWGVSRAAGIAVDEFELRVYAPAYFKGPWRIPRDAVQVDAWVPQSPAQLEGLDEGPQPVRMPESVTLQTKGVVIPDGVSLILEPAQPMPPSRWTLLFGDQTNTGVSTLASRRRARLVEELGIPVADGASAVAVLRAAGVPAVTVAPNIYWTRRLGQATERHVHTRNALGFGVLVGTGLFGLGGGMVGLLLDGWWGAAQGALLVGFAGRMLLVMIANRFERKAGAGGPGGPVVR